MSTGRSRTARLRHVAVDVRPLRQPDFRRLFIGQGVSFVGYQLTAVAVPVQMYAITGSSLWVGVIGIAAFVPLVVAGLWGGAVSDAVDRRRLLHRLLVPGMGRDRRPARPGSLGRRQRGPAAPSRRRPVGGLRPVLPGARCDPAAAPAARAGASGQHPELHDEQRRHRDRPTAGRGGAGPLVLRRGVRDRRDLVHGGAVRRIAVAADPTAG